MVNILNAESEIYFLGFRDKDKIILIYELLWSVKTWKLLSPMCIFMYRVYMYNLTLPIYFEHYETYIKNRNKKPDINVKY